MFPKLNQFCEPISMKMCSEEEMLFILYVEGKSSSILISSHQERRKKKNGESGERGEGERYKECF